MSDVYWNVRSKLFSIREKGKVIDRVDKLFVLTPKFVVNEAGRQKVLRTKRKNVHAFIRGEIELWTKEVSGKFFRDNWATSDYTTVVYNPYDKSGLFRMNCVFGEILITEKVNQCILMACLTSENGKSKITVKIGDV